MAWDDEKQVAPGTEDGELTPEEWNEHVADQKNHSERHESNGDDELSVEGLSGELADEQDAKPHDIGGPTHTADTLANLNSKVSDATLDDTADPREPEAHAATHEGGSDSLNVFDLTGDLVGQGLERVNDTLQVLSSIWDGTNVVADVDNTNTTTQALEAGSAIIDGFESNIQWTKISPTETTGQFDLSENSVGGDVFAVVTNVEASGGSMLSFNEDGENNQNYTYYDVSGTRVDNADGIVICEPGTANRHTAISYIGIGGSAEPAVSVNHIEMRIGRGEPVAAYGSRRERTSITHINHTRVDDITADKPFTVYEGNIEGIIA